MTARRRFKLPGFISRNIAVATVCTSSEDDRSFSAGMEVEMEGRKTRREKRGWLRG